MPMSSDYGGHMIANTMSAIPQKKEPLTSSYATVTQKQTFPTKDQAIVMDSIENVPLSEYIIAVGKLVNPSNIRFASKISMNRVCIYLSSKEIVTNISEKNSKINIGNNTISIRPLLTKFKRVILSNVCPIIPHLVLEDELKKLNIRLASSITFLRAGIAEPGYAHILSFRRQVYVHPDDIDKIPDSLKINFDDTAYWIYLSSDDISCFLCKQKGHLAKNCETNVSNLKESFATNLLDSTQKENLTIDPLLDSVTSNLNAINDFPELPPPPSNSITSKPQKRPLSATNSSNDDGSILNLNVSNIKNSDKVSHRIRLKKPKSDKTNKNTTDRLEEQLLPLKPLLISEDNPYVLNYTQFKSFIERSVGNPDIKDLSTEYTTDNQALITMLRQNYLNLTERNIKNRFTRIINKLSNPPSKEYASSDTSASTDGDEDDKTAVTATP